MDKQGVFGADGQFREVPFDEIQGKVLYMREQIRVLEGEVEAAQEKHELANTGYVYALSREAHPLADVDQELATANAVLLRSQHQLSKARRNLRLANWDAKRKLADIYQVILEATGIDFRFKDKASSDASSSSSDEASDSD